MTEFNKCTCVKVNKEKMDLIKKKGLNLQDILDKAMDGVLNLNKSEITQLSIDELNKKIEKLTIQRDEALVDCQKRIDLLIKNLNESKEHEKMLYDKQINYLISKRDYLMQQLQ